ncbi:MAG: hypothetical protein M1826_000347 [Phylliscum demangeonii]|nr:MAG: hypothetical protein M1826_000347 [Phylliscum demangeonii]
MHFLRLVLLATTVLAVPLPESIGGPRYNIMRPHPDEHRIWQELKARVGALKLYHQCMNGFDDGEAPGSDFEYEKHKSCMRAALAESGGVPEWVTDTPSRVLADGTVKPPPTTEPGAGAANMPFHKQTHQLWHQLSHWQHLVANNARRFHFSRPVNAKAAPAEETFLRAVQRAAVE